MSRKRSSVLSTNSHVRKCKSQLCAGRKTATISSVSITKIKKTLEPHQVTAIRDTREKADISLDPLMVMQGTLTTGDFSVKGLEHVVAIERKSLQDLIMCVGKERDRFEREIQRLLAYTSRALVIETTWETIELKRYLGEVHPNAVIGSLLSWSDRGLPIHLVGSNERAGRYISRLLFTAARRRWAESHGFVSAMISVDETPPEMLPNVLTL